MDAQTLEVGTLNRTRLKGLIAAALGASLLAMQIAPVAAAPKGGTSKSLSISAAGLTGLGEIVVSAGEGFPISITIANTGKQTLNSVQLLVGQDDNPTTAANGDATPPALLPSGVTVASTHGSCASGPQSLLTCLIGTLPGGRSAAVTIDLVFETSAAVAEFRTKATVKVAEGGSDNGSNTDSFLLEGTLTVEPFSCTSVSAFRPGSSARTVSTSPIGSCSEGSNAVTKRQQTAVTLPGSTTTIKLSEGGAIVGCPSVPGLSCIGDAIWADIEDDSLDDVVTWTLKYDVSAGPVNLNKLVIYHYDDESDQLLPVDGISLKQNACHGPNDLDCGTASVVDGILTIQVKTLGNGKIRLLG